MSDWEDVFGAGVSAESVISSIQGPRAIVSRQLQPCETWDEAKSLALTDPTATIRPDPNTANGYLVELDWLDYDGFPSYSGPAGAYREWRLEDAKKRGDDVAIALLSKENSKKQS